MTPRLFPIAAVAALTACAVPPAGTYTATNRLEVVPSAANGFEVLAQAGTSGPAYFCAAADYANRRLGARRSESVTVTRPNGPSQTVQGRRGATFTVTDGRPTRGFSKILVRAESVGDSLTIAHALTLCDLDEVEFNTFD